MGPPGFEVVVDRYYGGAISVTDGRTRFPISSLKDQVLEKRNVDGPNIWLKDARSLIEVQEIVSFARSQTESRLVLRGQTSHYRLERELPNPFLFHPEIGETSLIASVWRPMLRTNPSYFGHFVNWSLLEWSSVLTEGFDADYVFRHGVETIRSGGLPMTISDMCDSDDPQIRRYGEFRYRLARGFNDHLLSGLSTLLQHYGLYSPLVDLTDDVDVAIFFATHRFRSLDGKASYEPCGSNRDEAVIYILRYDELEMKPYGRDEVIGALHPLRPERQQCAVALSDAFSVNLPADFLVGVIRLRGNSFENQRYTQEDLFPPIADDNFLRALKDHPFASNRVTDFHRTV